MVARSGFEGGAEWMRLGLGVLRKTSLVRNDTAWNVAGVAKYGACSVASLAVVLACAWTGWWWGLVLVVPAFYGVEAQTVFLFPILLDGSGSPIRESRRMTLRAGGTFSVMMTVLPIAFEMLAGGLLGRGVTRAWCTGCMAVLIWYDELLELR